jgi:hypothetical protein
VQSHRLDDRFLIEVLQILVVVSVSGSLGFGDLKSQDSILLNETDQHLIQQPKDALLPLDCTNGIRERGETFLNGRRLCYRTINSTNGWIIDAANSSLTTPKGLSYFLSRSIRQELAMQSTNMLSEGYRIRYVEELLVHLFSPSKNQSGKGFRHFQEKVETGFGLH